MPALTAPSPAPRAPNRSPARLVAGAALLHVLVATCLIAAGGKAAFQGEIDPHGIVLHLSADCLTYRAQVSHLAATWLVAGPGAWLAEHALLHARLYSLSFVLSFTLFWRLLGDGIAAAEKNAIGATYLQRSASTFGTAFGEQSWIFRHRSMETIGGWTKQ